jgi:hypothetical protein
MEHRHAVVRALLARARPIILEDWRADSCIASTAICIDVLDYFGLDARPLACRTVVWNRQLESGCWSVGIGHGDKRQGGWPGHLVALAAGDLLLDLSLDQASRPQHNIELGALGVYLPEDYLAEGYECEAFGCHLYYEFLPADQSFRNANDWKATSRRRETVGTIIRAVKDALKGEA